MAMRSAKWWWWLVSATWSRGGVRRRRRRTGGAPHPHHHVSTAGPAADRTGCGELWLSMWPYLGLRPFAAGTRAFIRPLAFAPSPCGGGRLRRTEGRRGVRRSDRAWQGRRDRFIRTSRPLIVVSNCDFELCTALSSGKKRTQSYLGQHHFNASCLPGPSGSNESPFATVYVAPS